MERTKNETTEKSTSKLKNSEPIPPTQREMHPSLTERDVLNQEEKTMPYEIRNCRKFQRKGFRTFAKHRRS